MEDSLKRRYSIKLISNIINGVMGAILVAIVPKALAPIAYGQFIYLQDFFAKVIGFLDMGTSIAFFTKLSADSKRKELISFYLLYSLAIFLILAISISIIIYFGYSNLFLPNIPIRYIYMGLAFGFLIWFIQILIKISDAYALTISVESIKIINKILSLLLLFYLIYFTTFNLDRYFLFHYISLISFIGVLIWLFIKRDIFKNIFIKFSIIDISKEFIEYCHPLLVYSIIAVLSGIFDIWLLQKVAGSTQTGFYGLAYSISAMCFLFTSAMTPIITREFSKSYASNNIENMRRLFFRYIPMLYSISAFLGIFISLQSSTLLNIFTDERFRDAKLALSLMALYPIHQTYGQLSGSIFYATNQTKLLRDISFIIQPISILLSIIFIYLLDLGAVGLALKMILAQILGVNIQLYLNAKFLDFKIKRFLYHQLYSILFFAIFAYISTIVVSLESAIWEFLISGLLYTILVIIFTFIFPEVFAITRGEIRENLDRIIDVIKRKIKK